jgi:Mn2+/Fe2+ NRAMP family transporter
MPPWPWSRLAGPAAKVLLAVGLAQPLLVLIMLVANSKRVMGKHTNGRWINVLGWGATGARFAAAAGLVLTLGQV